MKKETAEKLAAAIEDEGRGYPAHVVQTYTVHVERAFHWQTITDPNDEARCRICCKPLNPWGGCDEEGHDDLASNDDEENW